MSAPSDWAIAYDCDGTMISSEDGALMPLVTDHGLPEAARPEALAWRDRFIGRFRSGTINLSDYRSWLMGDVDRYVRHGLRRQTWQAVLQRVRWRPGLFETMGELHAVGVRQCVVSAAVADFIEYALELHGARHLVGAVYGARLIHDAEGVVVGLEGTSIVDPINKGDHCQRFAEQYCIPHDRILGVGDSIGDATLGHADHRIGVAESAAHAALLSSLGIMSEIVQVNGHFAPVRAAIFRRLGLPS